MVKKRREIHGSLADLGGGGRVRLAVLTALLISGGIEEAQGRVVGRILHVGFPLRAGIGASYGGDGYRVGYWLPVAVDLRLEQQAEFSGYLRIEQDDRDGDRNTCEVPVNLRADVGSSRVFWLYVIANPRNKDRKESFSVYLLNRDREAVTVVDAGGVPAKQLLPDQLPEELDTEKRLILDISEMPLVQLDRVGRSVDSLRREFAVARLPAGAMPPTWQGLEAVDYIVWDSPKADQMDSAQMAALIDWVRQGGYLVVGAGQTAQAIGKTALGKVLPVTVRGQTATGHLPALRKSLYKLLDNPDEYPRSFVVCLAKARPGANVEAHEGGIGSDLLVRQAVGNGTIVFVGASLRDVLSARSNPLFGVTRLLQLRWQQEEKEEAGGYPDIRNLFPDLHSVIDFQMSVGLYLSFAILFVIGYILVATLGCWQWLNSRKLLRHSWTAFGVAAAGASAVSVASVQFARGFGQRVSQLTVVDTEANSFDARAYCQFGVKTGSHANLDLWLPAAFEEEGETAGRTACSLRPLAPDPEWRGAGYVAPQRYQVYASLAALENVPFRATVKQFEGRWIGQLDGQLQAKIVVSGRRNVAAVRLDNDSWIANRLGVDLYDCFLLHCTQNVRVLGNDKATRDTRIYVHALGDLPNAKRIDRLADRLYKDKDGEPISAKALFARQLGEVQRRDWARGFSRFSVRGPQQPRKMTVNAHAKILLLLTTLEEFKPEPDPSGYGTLELERTHVRFLDRSHALHPDVVLFVAFSNRESPVRLCTRRHTEDGRGRWHPAKPSTSRTLYRVMIPIERPDGDDST